jgi:hypothetical protein
MSGKGRGIGLLGGMNYEEFMIMMQRVLPFGH